MPKSGEWVQPVMEGYEMKCCGCGLRHIFNFRIVRGTRDGKKIERVQLQAFRKHTRVMRDGKKEGGK